MNKDKFQNIELVIFDFDGVFTNNMVYVNEDGQESVRCFRSDGLGISKLKKIGVMPIIISTEINNVVQMRAKKLNIACYNGIKNKGLKVLSVCKELRINPKHTAYVGNDINDLEALKVVGLPIGVADSFPEILPFIEYKTKKLGGLGAVREVCDLIFNSKQ